MLNLGFKTSPSSQIFIVPSNFRNHRWGTEKGAFPWPSCYFFCKKLSNYNIISYYFKHKSVKSLWFKKVSDGQSYIHITIKCIFSFLQIIIRSQKNWCETLKLKFILIFLIVSIRHVLPTPWLSIQFTSYLIGGKIIQIVLGLILQLYPMANKTWLKDVLYFTFWDRIFARVCFYNSSFFVPSFRHQDLNSYYLVLATAKIPRIWKHMSLDVYICYTNLKIVTSIANELFNRNLSIVHPTLLFNFKN